MRPPLPPSRFRRVAKWVGVGVCVVILGMWAVSAWSMLRFETVHSSDLFVVGVGHGVLTILTLGDIENQPFLRRSGPGNQVVLGRRGPYGPVGWFWEQIEFDPGLCWPKWQASAAIYRLAAPIWCLVLLAAMPTAFLWHRDRRTVKPGYCVKCGYDLRASKKVCPECGAGIVQE